jgi:hypothetical protein
MLQLLRAKAVCHGLQSSRSIVAVLQGLPGHLRFQ